MRKLLNLLDNTIIRVFNRLMSRNVRLSEKEIVSLFSPSLIQQNKEVIHKKKVKKIAFCCMSVAMWKYGTIFKELLSEEGFDPYVLITPSSRVSINQRIQDIKDIINYCNNNNFPYIPLKNNYFYIGQDVDSLGFDIVFYTQPYHCTICKEYDPDKFRHSLFCYVPYDNAGFTSDFSYNALLHKIAYRVFYPFDEQKRLAMSYGQTETKIVITGPVIYDLFKQECTMKRDNSKKRIIWAPHHSIMADDWLHYSCFLDVYEYMFYIAEKFKKDIEIVFKPHPMLMPKLFCLWGQERTLSYYKMWNGIENGSYVNTASFPLFKSSDALIHDCASYTMDYMMTGKPCLYLLLTGCHEDNFISPINESFNAHYKAHVKDDIIKFIENVVLNGKDVKQNERNEIINKWFINKDGITATRKVVEELKSI